MIVTRKITIDLARRGVPPRIDAMQGDANTRKVEITLSENGVAWPVPDGVTAAVAFRKPDGTRGVYDKLPTGAAAITVTDNVVSVILAPQVLTVAGEVVAGIIFTNTDGDLKLSTISFVVSVAPDPSAGAVVSNDYYYFTSLDAVNEAIRNVNSCKVIPVEQEDGVLLKIYNESITGGTTYTPVLIKHGKDGGGLSTAQITALDNMFKICAFTKADVSAEYAAFKTAFGITDSGGEEEPDEPVNPEVTLSSISATYSGGSVPAGTALNDLTGIVVTAHYSDGSTATVTGYTLSGTIAEGSNTVTVTYQGMTTTITVTGTVVVVYTVTNNLTDVTNSNAQTEVTEGFYSATLTVADGYTMQSVVITMGGVDITADVYTAETGSILITEVTGNIVITAVAAEPKEISMTELTSQYIDVYSDNGSTKLKTSYFDYFATNNKTESDASVTVEITNSGDSDCSGEIYIGCDKVNYATKKMISLAAGESVRYEYTVKGGCVLGVCVPNASAITVRAYGVFDVYQPTAEFAVTSTQVTTAKTYSDGTTDNLLKSANYQYVVCTTETFAEDTDLIVSIVGGETDVTISGTEWYFGSVDPEKIDTIYYGVKAGGSNTSVKAGQVRKTTYTVKAGYAFAISNVTANLTADMVYVEKA